MDQIRLTLAIRAAPSGVCEAGALVPMMLGFQSQAERAGAPTLERGHPAALEEPISGALADWFAVGGFDSPRVTVGVVAPQVLARPAGPRNVRARVAEAATAQGWRSRVG